ncbi:UDP-N-acetylglucosamine 2-epimerase [Clostridium sp. E02]|uniref:UDP-N-acetylglucosamine 2-epimerase n=1 Tax=Clostridium sp. E02 TaxID=2487134 RepID=UPI000F5361D6|nr:UDP-N-acetylglucosamine 2-epimerase [Clostridium sp. E02]
MIRLCVVTGSRADYGLLLPVIERIRDEKDFTLSLLATGSHLDTRYGNSSLSLEAIGIEFDETVEMNLASDSPYGICTSMGVEMIGITQAYHRLNPDMILLLGDRYEIFTAASAALILRIPVAHIHGGELSSGAFDDSLRHGITKMSYLHFTSTLAYKKRVIQMGESPDRVFFVGSLGIERIQSMKFLTKQELENSLSLNLSKPIALITYHCATLDSMDETMQFAPLLSALESFPQLYVVFTGSNSDPGGGKINEMIHQYVKQHPHHSATFPTLGSQCYLSLMKHSQIVAGNSSSGILEAPFLKIPSINIGKRQDGRIKPDSVITCGCSTSDIQIAIENALAFDWHKAMKNPYECSDTSKQILVRIKQAFASGIQLNKKFYDIDWSL